MNLDRIRAKKSYQIPEYHCKLEVDLCKIYAKLCTLIPKTH